MGTQGPQGSICLGGQANRINHWDQQIAEHSLGRSATLLEQAARSFLFVYQVATGQVVEQNMLSLVLEAVRQEQDEVSDTTLLWRERFRRPGIAVAAESCAGVVWGINNANLMRVCAALVVNPTPVVQDGRVGGIDLGILVEAP